MAPTNINSSCCRNFQVLQENTATPPQNTLELQKNRGRRMTQIKTICEHRLMKIKWRWGITCFD